MTAGERRIPKAVIDHDYVLPSFLIGLAGHPLRDVLAFKGGTAIRRCWFEDYGGAADTSASSVVNRRWPRFRPGGLPQHSVFLRW